MVYRPDTGSGARPACGVSNRPRQRTRQFGIAVAADYGRSGTMIEDNVAVQTVPVRMLMTTVSRHSILIPSSGHGGYPLGNYTNRGI